MVSTAPVSHPRKKARRGVTVRSGKSSGTKATQAGGHRSNLATERKKRIPLPMLSRIGRRRIMSASCVTEWTGWPEGRRVARKERLLCPDPIVVVDRGLLLLAFLALVRQGHRGVVARVFEL